ncbi:MAG: hypothetical protein GXN99_01585 [Candidatus Nanohaloarchaeota archaeon]|nr:hypothetical protein [Candidatus Nanohaloarchaeota archaeon]
MLGFLKKHDKNKKDEELEQIKESIDKESVQPQQTAQPSQLSNLQAGEVPPLEQALSSSPSDNVSSLPSSNVDTSSAKVGEPPVKAQPSADAVETLQSSQQPVESSDPSQSEKSASQDDLEKLFSSNSENNVEKGENQPSPTTDILPSQPTSSSLMAVNEDVIKEAEATVKISPPLFISVQKYKEIINELLNLKASLVSMESVVKELNRARDEEVNVLKTSIDELDNINKKIKYFVEAFKING